MPFSDLVGEILDADLCTACGGCVAVCPEGVLEIPAHGADLVPRLTESGSQEVCGACRLCLDVCPGKDPAVEESEVVRFGRSRGTSERWTGIQRNAYLAWSTRPDVLGAASAGGATTALLVSALETDQVDAVLVVGQDPNEPWKPKARLTDDVEEVIDAAQATYCIAPNLQLLADTEFERVAVAGLPCQIEALGKMCNLPDVPLAARRVSLLVEVACSSNTSLAGTRHLIEKRLGVKVEDVGRLRYRAGAYPGRFSVWTRSGDLLTLPFHELVTEFKHFKTHRCLSCPDWWSGLADISVADGDPNIFKASKGGQAAEKRTLLISRTQAGDHLIDRARAEGDLICLPTEFDADQSLGLQRKRHRYHRYLEKEDVAIPSAVALDGGPEVVLGDDEIIERLSDPTPSGAPR